MDYDPQIHHRRSIRLAGYDYSQSGAYFVTVCTQGRQTLFGTVADGMMEPNDAGRMIQAAWDGLPQRFPGLELDAFIVMPNHVHGIIVIPVADDATGDMGANDVGAGLVPAPCAPTTTGATTGATTGGATTRVAPTLGDVVGAFKSWTTVLYARGVRGAGWVSFDGRLWQRNYYEHIIRNEAELDRIREYIMTNPGRWAEDREDPRAKATATPPHPPH